MRRIGLRMMAAALTFTVGAACAALPLVVSQLKRYFEDPVVEAPALRLNDDELKWLEFYDKAHTPSDFGQFWAEFKTAVSRDDREELYALTAHDGFSWETGELRLHRRPVCGTSPYDDVPYSGCQYLIKSYDEFLRNYNLIFTPSFKKAVLRRTPLPNWPSSYMVTDGEGRFAMGRTLMFVDLDGQGFKFTGMWDMSRLPTIDGK